MIPVSKQTCRLCRSNTKPFLVLGRVPLPEEFRSPDHRKKPVITYPLGLSYCVECLHVQLTNPVAPDPIYKKNYFYDYSVTALGRTHWEHLAKNLVKRYGLSAHDLAVDVGSNTGTLLSYVKALGIRILGVDPADKLVRIARANGVSTITGYFTPAIAQKIVKKYGQARLITCTNVFDHVTDLTEITEAFRLLLLPEGTLIIEAPYFYRMITQRTHIPYLQQIDFMMLTQFVSFFQQFGMALVDAQEIPLHGGSIRLYVRQKGKQKPTKRLARLIGREQAILRAYPSRLIEFARAVKAQRNAVVRFVRRLKQQGKTIAAVGASAKGITLLNYAGLGPKEIDFITEKSPLKIGRFTPSGIPVVGDHVLIKKQPDYAILLSWNFAREVMKNLQTYKGIWIIPIPKLHVRP